MKLPTKRLVAGVVAVCVGLSGFGVSLAAAADYRSGPQGPDVSRWQGDFDWGQAKKQKWSFAIIKATDGPDRDPKFDRNWRGAGDAGLIRGAYHFGRPDKGDGASQARHFIANGGAWTEDGRTLPGTLDFEDRAELKQACYGMSKTELGAWVTEFATAYQKKTGRYPMLYSTKNYIEKCVGADLPVLKKMPLWIARWEVRNPEVPKAWSDFTFHQYTTNNNTLDMNVFNGTQAELAAFAKYPSGRAPRPTPSASPSRTATPSSTPSASRSATPSASPSRTATPSARPSATPEPSNTPTGEPSQSVTPTPSPSAPASPKPSPSLSTVTLPPTLPPTQEPPPSQDPEPSREPEPSRKPAPSQEPTRAEPTTQPPNTQAPTRAPEPTQPALEPTLPEPEPRGGNEESEPAPPPAEPPLEGPADPAEPTLPAEPQDPAPPAEPEYPVDEPGIDEPGIDESEQPGEPELPQDPESEVPADDPVPPPVTEGDQADPQDPADTGNPEGEPGVEGEPGTEPGATEPGANEEPGIELGRPAEPAGHVSNEGEQAGRGVNLSSPLAGRASAPILILGTIASLALAGGGVALIVGRSRQVRPQRAAAYPAQMAQQSRAKR